MKKLVLAALVAALAPAALGAAGDDQAGHARPAGLDLARHPEGDGPALGAGLRRAGEAPHLRRRRPGQRGRHGPQDGDRPAPGRRHHQRRHARHRSAEPQASRSRSSSTTRRRWSAPSTRCEPKLDDGAREARATWRCSGADRRRSTSSATSPSDARPRRADAKVLAWEGDPKSVEAYRAAGLHPVVLSSTDIVPSLQTGMIDCVPNVPSTSSRRASSRRRTT